MSRYGSRDADVELTQILGDVYLSNIEDGPKTITHQGRELQRFMDVFYVGRATNELSPEEVRALCSEREKHPEYISKSRANETVHSVFSELILSLRPRTILEIGPGDHPILLNHAYSPDSYYLADADISTTPFILNSPIRFDTETPLPADLPRIDLAISAFVLHFTWSDQQTREVARVLGDDSAFVFNLYRIDRNSRRRLERTLRGTFGHVAVIIDPLKSCTQHEYWLTSKSQAGLDRAKSAIYSVLTAEVQRRSHP